MSDPLNACNPTEINATGTGNLEEPKRRFLSAKANRASAAGMTEEECEAAEREAKEWARRVNCC